MSKREYLMSRKEVSEFVMVKIMGEAKTQSLSPNTIQRQNIHRDIQAMVKEKKGKIEILSYLSNKYKDTKLSIYFDQWIDDCYKKQRNKESQEFDNGER